MRFPDLPAVRDLIKIYDLSAKSALGQHFILDKNITDKIVRQAGILPSDRLVVEIGPGPTLLTRSILDAQPQTVVAIEKDSRFLPSLRLLENVSDGRLKVLIGDALTLPHSSIMNAAGLEPPGSESSSSSAVRSAQSRLHIVGNLPFNIATPLLVRWIKLLANKQGLFGLGYDVRMTLMFQKEVAMRLTAAPSTPNRGRLSVLTQSYCDAKELFSLPPSVFTPAPKVEAAIVQLSPHQTLSNDLGGYYSSNTLPS